MSSGPPVIPISRLLLADPPPGCASSPDLPGYGWSGPAPHKWAKEDVAGDAAVHRSFVAAETANADDYTLETVDASHFIIDERPDLVRARLIALADETSA